MSQRWKTRRQKCSRGKKPFLNGFLHPFPAPILAWFGLESLSERQEFVQYGRQKLEFATKRWFPRVRSMQHELRVFQRVDSFLSVSIVPKKFFHNVAHRVTGWIMEVDRTPSVPNAALDRFRMTY